MPLYIKDDVAADLVGQLARLRGMTKQDAVKMAVKAELDRARAGVPLRDRLERLWNDHPLPRRVGKPADKEFFDELSGDF